jgi:hypothetical protein
VVDILLLMIQTTKTAIVFLMVVQFTVACGSGVGVVKSPTAPAVLAPVIPATPVVAVIPVTTPSQHWTLTTSLKSVTGPELCSDFVGNASAKTGTSADWSMIIQRAGDSIRVINSDPADPSEHSQYDGVVEGEAFSVKSLPFSGLLVCRGTRVPYSEVDAITGRFEGEDRRLIGEEVDSYGLPSGETVTYLFAWRAVRID